MTGHNLDVLVAESSSSNLEEGSEKGNAAVWQRFGHEAWLQSDNGDVIYHFGSTDHMS